MCEQRGWWNMKKRLLLVMMLIGIVALLIHSTLTLNANKALSDSKNASYEMTETTKSFTTDYTSYKTDLGTTTYNGNTYKQRVHVFFQKQTKNSKIVTWAVQSDAGKLSRVPVSAILIQSLSALNKFARKHPSGLYPR